MKKLLLLLTALLISGFIVSKADSITYYHNDLQGSPVMATDKNGNVLWREEYKPHGEKFIKSPAAKNDVGFTGHQSEDDIGLVYMQQRYYDPLIGRFLSNDPVGFYANNPMSFNRYLYVNNNPYKYKDPTGEKLEFATGSTPAFKQAFSDVIKYHNKNGTAGTFARIEKAPEVVTIQEAAQPHDFYYNTKTNTLVFDPTSGLEVAPGQVQTPALVVLHEAGHAENDIFNSAQQQTDMATPDPAYNNVEEKNVIQNVETPAANKIGEPTRTNHGGTPKTVSCPTCDK